MYIDLHCDTLERIYRTKKNGSEAALRKNEFHVDLLRMKKADCILQNFAVYTDSEQREEEAAFAMIALFHKEMNENRDFIAPVFSMEDIDKHRKEGRMSAMLTIEGAETILSENASENETWEELQKGYRLGVRMMSVTWNRRNAFGMPHGLRPDVSRRKALEKNQTQGLTKKGCTLVRQLDALGVIADISHLSDEGAHQVLSLSKKPVVASHSNFYGVTKHTRNLTDALAKKVALGGGVIGLNFYPPFLQRNEESEGRLYRNLMEKSRQELLAHIRYGLRLVGKNVLALGTDFDGFTDTEGFASVTDLEELGNFLELNKIPASAVEGLLYRNALRCYRDAFSS